MKRQTLNRQVKAWRLPVATAALVTVTSWVFPHGAFPWLLFGAALLLGLGEASALLILVADRKSLQAQLTKALRAASSPYRPPTVNQVEELRKYDKRVSH